MKEIENNKFSILVVDDEDIVLSLVRDALEDDGFAVITASDSLDALNIIESKQIDLLISDIRMPRMSGIELVKKAKEIQPELAFIFMTGYANLNSAKDAIKQGASDYILKPFELNEIRQAVYKAFDKHKENIKADNSKKQLNRLSDLHQMLFTAADENSLINLALKFAQMQYRTEITAILNWQSNRTDFKMISICHGKVEEVILSDEIMTKSLDRVQLPGLQEILTIDNIRDYPLIKAIEDDNTVEQIVSKFEKENGRFVFVPINRSNSVYGFMIIALPDNITINPETDMDFLTITAHQLAMSLENLDLLKESQEAYSKLKAVQDDTIQLEKMATKGEISAEIGHELNNFLGVVASSLSLMDFHLKKENYNELDKYIQIMNENIDKMKNFTNNLMDLQSISTKKETINFSHLLNDVIEYLKPQKRFKGVDIEYSYDSDDIMIEADITHIQQLLYNLLNNAADSMKDKSEKKLSISTTRSYTDDAFTLIIEDSGCGFSPEYIEKAFKEKFTTKTEGHGFGLLVCKRIIENHHGRLNIESSHDVGTKISIEFPLLTSRYSNNTVSV